MWSLWIKKERENRSFQRQKAAVQAQERHPPASGSHGTEMVCAAPRPWSITFEAHCPHGLQPLPPLPWFALLQLDKWAGERPIGWRETELCFLPVIAFIFLLASFFPPALGTEPGLHPSPALCSVLLSSWHFSSLFSFSSSSLAVFGIKLSGFLPLGYIPTSFFWARVSLIHSVVQTGLECMILLPQPPLVLRLWHTVMCPAPWTSVHFSFWDNVLQGCLGWPQAWGYAVSSL